MTGKNFFGTALLLLVAFSVLYLVNYWVHPDYTRPNFEIFPEMFHSVAYESFSPNRNFKDGATEQSPPDGTIARGLMPFEYGSDPAEAKRAGAELRNPFLSDSRDSENTSDVVDQLDRGRKIFANICAPCHGVGGEGDGPIVKRGFPPPPSLKLDNALSMRDGEMYHIISLGRGNMPALDVQVDRSDRWKVILHIRELQRSPEDKL